MIQFARQWFFDNKEKFNHAPLVSPIDETSFEIHFEGIARNIGIFVRASDTNFSEGINCVFVDAFAAMSQSGV